MTKAFLIVSVACNVWFLFLLFYDRIMDTKLIRFFRHIAGLWRSLDSTVAEQGKDKEIPHADTSDIIGKSRFKMASTRTTAAILAQEAATSDKGIELSEEEATFDEVAEQGKDKEIPHADTSDIIGKSRFKMASTRTTAAILAQEAATSDKGIELSEEEATFDDGNTETVSRPTQVPEDKLDETFTSIPPSELEYGEDEPEDEEPDKKQASGSSFEDIDMAVRTIRKESPSDEEMRHAGKVMTELDGTELFTRITERLTDDTMSERLAKAMAVFVDTVNMTVTQQKEKVFVIPDNIEEFDFRNYV
ncbi:conjugal transfer protein TraD [Bacteroides stercoris]|nr:conjugal transfer protein TraD [Bacteroides stercoris]